MQVRVREGTFFILCGTNRPISVSVGDKKGLIQGER